MRDGRPLPEWCGQRHDTNPDKWRGRNAAPLIAATVANAATGSIASTYSSSGVGELLRTYALVQARYGFDDLESIARAHRLPIETLEIAHTWLVQEWTNRALGTSSKSWDDGTGSAIARQIGEIDDPSKRFEAALPHLMTAASNAISRTIGSTDRDALESLRKLKRRARALLEGSPRPSTRLDEIGGREYRYHDEQTLRRLASMIETARKEAGAKVKAVPGNAIPEGDGDSSGWLPLIPSANRLTRPHLGKIGSKRRAADSGRTLRYPSRALTDPHRRVFERRSRSRDALVVLDLSGSMSYTMDDLDRIIECARGAVVVGYSAVDDSTDPNFHLLAKDGHRVENLPDVPGGNGIDGVALTYAVRKYRKTPTTPVIWVSDGGVTGAGDYSRRALALDMVKRLKQTKATQVTSIHAGIDLLERMAQGHRPAARIAPGLLHHAGLEA